MPPNAPSGAKRFITRQKIPVMNTTRTLCLAGAALACMGSAALARDHHHGWHGGYYYSHHPRAFYYPAPVYQYAPYYPGYYPYYAYPYRHNVIIIRGHHGHHHHWR